MASASLTTACNAESTLNVDLILSDLGMPTPGNRAADVACDVNWGFFNVSASGDFCIDMENWMNSESDTPFLDSIVVL